MIPHLQATREQMEDLGDYLGRIGLYWGGYILSLPLGTWAQLAVILLTLLQSIKLMRELWRDRPREHGVFMRSILRVLRVFRWRDRRDGFEDTERL